MSIFKTIAGVLIAVVLASCGGGGGSSGTASGSSSSGTTTTTTTASPTLALSFTDSAGAVLSVNAITSGSNYYAKATLTDASGNAVKNALVSFSTDTTIGKLSQTVALTDASGVAKVQIAPAAVSTVGAAALTASAVYSGATVSASANYQTSAASVSFASVVASPSSISSLQTTAVTATVNVGGVLATAGQVSVTFSASPNCGSFSPSVASTSSYGTASTTFSAVGCSGPVTISANAANATTGSGAITVTAAAAANISFTTATQLTLVVSSASSGVRQSTLTYKVVDASNTPVSGVAVNFTLDQQSTGAGVTFALGGTTQSGTTDSNGLVQVAIQSGSLPTPVVVIATLASDSTMFAKSSGIAVTAGKASQDKSSLSADKLSIEGLNVDGVTSTLTWRVTDRQGNPVPVGSTVIFVASSGTVQGSCSTDSNGACSVTYTTSGNRPSASAGGVAGRAVILAYMDGEETFVDTNGNNTWDSGESFSDMGVAYRDDNWNGVWDANEQTYPGGLTGSSACPATSSSYLSVANTCSGTWSSSIRVRQLISITLASSYASITSGTLTTSARTGFTVSIGDLANPTLSVPTGSTVSAVVTTGSSSCSVSSVSPNVVRNQNDSGSHDIHLSGTGCGGAVVEVSVTVPSGTKTTTPFTIP